MRLRPSVRINPTVNPVSNLRLVKTDAVMASAKRAWWITPARQMETHAQPA